jgi:hypothetical protein
MTSPARRVLLNPHNHKDTPMDTNSDFFDDVEDLDTASVSAPPPPPPPADDDWWPSDAADAAPARPRSKRTWVLAGIGAVAIAAGSIVGINVASSKATKVGAGASVGGPGGGLGGGPGGQGAPGGFPGGTIASISGSVLTLSSFNGSSTKVVTSASTTVTQSATVTLADIKVGDYVVVQGLGSTTKIAANRIIDTGATAITLNQPGGGGAPPGGVAPGGNAAGGAAGNPPPNGGGFPGGGPGGGGPGGVGLGGDDDGAVFYGKVTAVNGTTLTVQSTATATTTWTVSSSSSTRYGAMTTLAVSDLKAGESVAVTGTTATDGTITATNIQVMAQ